VNKLTDYLDLKTLQDLQETFRELAQAPICICSPTGEPFAESCSFEREKCSQAIDSESLACEVPVKLEDEVVARIVCCNGDGSRSPQALRKFLELLADVIGNLCNNKKRLRTRIEELAALYRLSGEFTSQRDLQGVLDMVAKTVVDVLKVKGCTIRLLSEDKSELVIKAVANLSEEYIRKGPIVLANSKIDQESFATGKSVKIADQSTDPRVMYPAQAKREGIVSAIAAPMIYKNNPEGSIRVYAAEKREFDWFEVSLLEAIASEAAGAIVNARLYQEAVKAANMERDLKLAGVVQRRMIPSGAPKIPGFDIAAIYVPCFQVGGDFYDFIDLPPENMGFVVCDVVGKGVRASLLMASIRASLRATATKVYDISEVLSDVNHYLCADTVSSDFATLFYGVVDYKTRLFTYANAGHVAPLLFRDGKCCHLTTGGGVLGLETSFEYEHDSFTLNSGDIILAYTDGLSEAMNFNDEEFGHERVKAAAMAAVQDGKDAKGIAKHALWEMRRFAGLQKRFDDLTLIVIKVL